MNSPGSKTLSPPLKSSTPTRPLVFPPLKPTHPHPDISNIDSSCSEPSSLIRPKETYGNIRVLNINCQGLRTKISEFKSLLLYTKPDIVCGNESWLVKDIKSSELFPDEYQVFRKDRIDGGGGGVFILVKKNLIALQLENFDSDCEVIWVKIQLKRAKELFICSFYMPYRDINTLNEFEKSIQKVNPQGSRNLLICGDFNSPDINWEHGFTHAGAPDKHSQDRLIEISNDNSLIQLQEKPTRNNSCLDLTFVTNPSLIKCLNNIPGVGDHEGVIIDSFIKPSYSIQKKRKCFIFNKADWDSLNTYCEKLSESIIQKSKLNYDTNHLWDLFKSTLNLGISNFIPSKYVKKRSSLPWMNKHLVKLIKKKCTLFKKAKMSGDWTDYRNHQKTCRKEMRKTESDYVNKTINEGLAENNPKPFWKYIKSKKSDNIGVAPLKVKGKLESDPKKKAETLLSQFRSVFTTNESDELPPVKLKINDSLTSIKIETKGVEKLLSSIQSHKAFGPDEIPNIVLKNCAKALAPGITVLFQSSLDSGILPKDWTDANISPVFKKGDRHLAENYRPVSLTSVLSKLLEHIICHELHKHFEKNSVLTNINHGFRAGFSCETQLTITFDDLAKNSNKNSQTDVAILDFSKAFDTVPHKKLLHKLCAYGVRGNLHTWISNFLCNRKMKVIIDGESSSETAVLSGVPQGTVLGPLLFLVHINDLPDCVKSSVRLFADDCLLYREIKSRDDQEILQNDLKNLEIWATTWGMRFNAKKCYILSVTSKGIQKFYELDSCILKEVENNPYLGLLISNDLKWSTHIVHKKCPQECKKTAYIALV